MANYSIKELEALTGIKAHTIRIWEKRHNLINPERSDTNIRSYSDKDLKQILNVSTLYNQGFKISKIASLTEAELCTKISELANDTKPENEIFIDQLTISMVDLDEAKFEKTLSSCILKKGFEETINNIVYPFLRKIGILWLSNKINPVQEHFISNLIRQKMIVAIDGLQDPISRDESVVLFLQETELHELGLLFFHYLVKKRGYKTYYLGQNVPYPDLKKACDKIDPDILISSVAFIGAEKNFADYLALMEKDFKNKRILMTGQPLFNKSEIIPEGITLFKNPADLLNLLT